MRSTLVLLFSGLALLASAPARACDGLEALFQDTFTEADPAWNANGDEIKIVKGKMLVSPKADQRNVWANLYQGDIFDDIELCVSMTIQTDGDPNWTRGGLLFWANDYDNYYALEVAPDGSFQVARRVRGRWIYPVKWRKSPALKTGKGATNALRLRLVGGEARIGFNGREVLSFRGRPPEDGSLVGVIAVSPASGKRSVIAFDDFRVVRPGAANASQGTGPAPPNAAARAEAPGGNEASERER